MIGIEIAYAAGTIEIGFLRSTEEARKDPTFLDATRIRDSNAGGGDEILGDIPGKGEGNSDSHN